MFLSYKWVFNVSFHFHSAYRDYLQPLNGDKKAEKEPKYIQLESTVPIRS